MAYIVKGYETLNEKLNQEIGKIGPVVRVDKKPLTKKKEYG